jgi:hypothetical protein
LVVDEVEDGVVSRLTLELRSHVTCTVHCSEGKAITYFDVTGNLLSIHVGDVVWSPGFLD